MDILQNMRVFMRIVELGSFTAAAEDLNVTTAYASRAVSSLEGHLQTRLLNRTTRRLSLTEAGERYFQRITQVVPELDYAEAEARNASSQPSGKLKIQAPTGLGHHYVVRAISEYRKLYPEVAVQLTLAQRFPDLIEDGYDVALVAAVSLSDSNLVSQKIGTAFSIACASPTYLRERGVPTSPQDLSGHTCLRLNSPVFPMNVWTFDGPGDGNSVHLGPSEFEANTTESLVEAVRHGMGIELIPIYAAMDALRSQDLVWVLPDYRSQEMSLYALYLSRTYIDAKIRTWVQYLRQTLPALLAEEQREAYRFAQTR